MSINCLHKECRNYYECQRGDDNIDIDVCMGCGRYYGVTEALVDLWHDQYHPRAGEVMPQLCSNCMDSNAG